MYIVKSYKAKFWTINWRVIPSKRKPFGGSCRGLGYKFPLQELLVSPTRQEWVICFQILDKVTRQNLIVTSLFSYFYSVNWNSDNWNSPLTRTKFRFHWWLFTLISRILVLKTHHGCHDPFVAKCLKTDASVLLGP